MATLYDICDNVRIRLGQPRAQSPDDGAILNQVSTQFRLILRHKRATGNPWNFNDLIVTVIPNIDTFSITATDFGQPLAVLTHDPSNPSWIPRLVKIYEPQNLMMDLPAIPQQWAANAFIPYDGSYATAQRVAFYWRDNQAFMQVWPTPLQQASYKVRYLQNAESTTTAALTSTPLSVEDSDLVELRAAVSLLPLSTWFDESTKEFRAINAEKRNGLAMTLANDEREARRQFEAAAQITSGPRIYSRWQGSIVG